MKKADIQQCELRTGHLTKSDLLQLASFSELRMYENDLPLGPILEIGVGLGCEAIYHSERGRKVVAVDKTDYFLHRIQKISENSIVTLKSKMPNGALPKEKFALVILSNILHFLPYADSKVLCEKVANLLENGGYIIVRVHSSKHPYSKSGHKKKNKFEHFFSAKEVKGLFPRKVFDIIYFSNYSRKFSSSEIKIMGLEQEPVKEKDSYTMIVKKIK